MFDSIIRLYFTSLAWCQKRPYLTLSGFFLVFVLAVIHLPSLRIVTDLRSLIPDDEVAAADQQLYREFELDDYLMVVLSSKEGVYRPECIEAAALISAELEKVEGINKIRSLMTEDNIIGQDYDLEFKPFIEPSAAIDSAGIQQEIRQFPGIESILVSADGHHLALLAEIETDVSKSGIYFTILDQLKTIPLPEDVKVSISGMPVFEGVLGTYIFKDLLVMLPIVAVILIILLQLSFRSLPFTLLCLAETIFVDCVTLGLMAALGIPLYIIHAIMPVILMGLAITDEIHIFSRYFEACEDAPGAGIHQKLSITLKDIAKPVILTSLTTATAFLAFIPASMKAMQMFGIFTAVGVLLAMVFSLYVSPIIIKLLKIHGRPGTQRIDHPGRLAGFGSLIIKHKNLARILLLLVVVTAIFGISQVYINDSWIANFKEDSGVAKANDLINKEFSGTMLLYVSLDSGRDGGIHDPHFLTGLEQIQKKIEAMEGVGGSISMIQPLEKLNFELTGKYALRDSKEANAQFLSLLDTSEYSEYWDFNYRKALLTFFIVDATYQRGKIVFPELERLVKQYLPEASITLGGHFILGVHWVGTVERDQPLTLLISLISILALSSLIFNSILKGMVVVAPVLLAVMMNFGLMGFLGLPLGVATSMFSSIVFGIGIDFAIHLQRSFEVNRPSMGLHDAIRKMFTSAGSAILWSTTIVFISFIVLVFSEMPPVQKLGVMVSSGVLCSFLASYLIVPLLLLTFQRRK